MKNVLLIASEAVPFIKTGGLADVAGSLPKYFDKTKFDVRVMIPKYTCIPWEYREKMVYKTHFYIDLAWRTQYVGVFELEWNGVTFYFIDNEFYFGGNKPYSWIHEDIEKFAFFSKAALSALPVLGFRPDIIHCNDWQTGLIPVYLKERFSQGEFYQGIKSIMTIHNLKFQGIWDLKKVKDITGLPDEYFTSDKLEAYDDANYLKGGIVYADRVTTVSETYAEDVQFVVLGTGEERYENMFRHYDWKYNDRVSANIYYSEDMSHKVYAACDAFLMPSLFEPCGLSQLMSLRYGTVPIVRETGGLKDTVEPYNEYEGKGTGFSFANYNAHEMLGIVNYAKDVYYNHKREWNKIVDRGMKTDFSWNSSARKYEELYNSL